MLFSAHAAAVAERFFPGSGITLFENAAAMPPVKVPNEWPLPPHKIDSYNSDKKLFVKKGRHFFREAVFWRSVLTFIIEKYLIIDEFDNIDQHDVEMGESRSDGALWRGEEHEEGPEEEPEEEKDLKLMAILEAKTPGSETAHLEKKVSPHLSLLLDDLINDWIGEKLGDAFCTSFCVCGTSLAHGRRRLQGHPI